MVMKLDTKTTILAACNPKGTFDPSLDLSDNTLIGPALLSRFDIVLVLLDRPEKEWDKLVSTYLLQQALGQHCSPKENEASNAFLQEYILYVRDQLKPTMSSGAKMLLTKFYQLQRQEEDRATSRTTVRMLESLLRCSEKINLHFI